MKQLLLTLACLLSVLIGQAAPQSYTWDNGKNTTKPFSAQSGKTQQTCLKTLNGVEWAFTFKNEETGIFYTAASAANGFQLGSSNQYTKILTVTTSGINGTIKSVKVNAKYSTNPAELSVTVGGTPFKCGDNQSVSLTTTNTDYTFTGTESASGEIAITYTRTSKGANYLKAITVEYEPDGGGGTTQTVAAPEFSVAAGIVAPGSTVDISCSTEGAQLEVSANEDPIDGISSNPYTYTFPAEEGQVILTAKAYITDQSGTKTHSNAVSKTYTVSTTPTPPVGTTKWVQTDITKLASGDVVIIVDKDSKTALDPVVGDDSPRATSVTLNGDPSEITDGADENMWFEIIKSGSDYSFIHVRTSTNGTTNKLYTTNDSKGVRVGTNSNNVFIWEDPYLKNTETSRYLGVYNKDWRCYLKGNINNIKSTQTAFYKKVVEQPTCERPVFTVNGETLANEEIIMAVEPGTEVTVSCPTAGATIKSLTINGNGADETAAVGNTSYTFRIYEETMVEVKYINGDVSSEPATAWFDLTKVEGQFTLTPLSELQDGDQIVLVNKNDYNNTYPNNTQSYDMSSLPATGSATANPVTLDDKNSIASPLTNAEVFTVEKNDDGTISLRSNVLNGDSPLYLQYVGPNTEISIASLAGGDNHKFNVVGEKIEGHEQPVDQLIKQLAPDALDRYVRYDGNTWGARTGVSSSQYTVFYRMVEKAAVPTFTPAGGEVPYNTEVTVSTTTVGAKLDVTVGDVLYEGKDSPFTFKVTAPVEVYATAYNVGADGSKIIATEVETDVVSYTIAKAAVPTFTPVGGVVPYNTEVTVSTTTVGAKLDVIAGDYLYEGKDSPFTFNVTAPVEVCATAYNVDADGKKVAVTESDIATASYAISSNVFKLATTIEPNKEYIVVAEKGGVKAIAMGDYNTNLYYNTVDAEGNFAVYGDIIKLTTNAVAKVVFVPTSTAGEYHIGYRQGDKQGYIVTHTDENKVGFSETNPPAASVSVGSDGKGTIQFTGSATYKYFRYNASSPRFTCYASKTVQDFYLYAAVETPAPTAKESITFRNDTETASLTTIVTGYDWSSGTPTPIENNYMTSEVNDGYICVYYDGLATADQAAAAEVNNGVLKYDKGTYGAPEAAANYANAAQTSPVKLHVEVELLGNKDGEYSSYKMPNPDVPGGWDDQTYLKYYGVNQTRIHDVDAPYVKVPITSKYSVVRATATGDGVTHTGSVESDVHAYYSPNGSTTGVEDVEAGSDSDAEVKYYNLQGVRISRPSNGVYIRVEGQRVSKVRVF